MRLRTHPGCRAAGRLASYKRESEHDAVSRLRLFLEITVSIEYANAYVPAFVFGLGMKQPLSSGSLQEDEAFILPPEVRKDPYHRPDSTLHHDGGPIPGDHPGVLGSPASGDVNGISSGNVAVSLQQCRHPFLSR